MPTKCVLDVVECVSWNPRFDRVFRPGLERGADAGQHLAPCRAQPEPTPDVEQIAERELVGFAREAHLVPPGVAGVVVTVVVASTVPKS